MPRKPSSSGEEKAPRKPTSKRKFSAQRCPRTLNQKQERFVAEWLTNPNTSPGKAYIAAGYPVGTRASAEASGRRLLRDPRIMQLLDEQRLKRMEATGIDADNTILRFHFLYMEGLRTGDLTNAAKALENIGKILGVYEKHNKQKVQYTMEDLDRLKKELRESGFNLDVLQPSPN